MKMRIHILFWTILVALVCAMVSMTGCATMPRDGEDWMSSYYRQKMGARGYMSSRYGQYRPVPVAPSNVGFNRPPVHWEGHPFRLEIVNLTQRSKYHLRCVIDDREHQRTAWGRVLVAYVRDPSGVRKAPLIPPGASSYLILGGGLHNIKCESYALAQVLPNGERVFEKSGERWKRNMSARVWHKYAIDDVEMLTFE